MAAHGFTLFDTPIGRCGIAWGERGIVGIQLPEGRESETRVRLRRRFPQVGETTPPAMAQQAIDDIVALLGGKARDLAGIALDMSGVPAFHQRVYAAARTIPPGATLSYGDIAARIDAPGAARAVGQALGRNPFAIIVPCHRVLAAGGRIGGFAANGGIATKLRLLALEGIQVDGTPVPAFAQTAAKYEFDPQVAVTHLSAADPRLGRIIERLGPFELELRRSASIFAALAEAIVYQQLTGKAAATIFSRLCALFPGGPKGLNPERILRLSDDRLRAVGLSRSKLLSLRDLARKAADGQVPSLAEVRRMSDDAIVERLTQVRGIGRWTAEMLLIFRLGRPDVLPVDDYGLRKGFAVALGKRTAPTRQEVEARGARWKPYRTVASWYHWRAAERGGLKGNRRESGAQTSR